MIGIFSKGILKTVPYLEELLGHRVILNPRSPEGLIAIAGWGHKPTAKKAMQKAKEWALPYWALEEGFIRSKRPEDPTLSLIVDTIGIYYNANQPSLLEQLIKQDIQPDLLNYGEHILKLVLRNRISKYNNHVPFDKKELPEYGEKVLLIDQTYEDMSVVLGMANKDTFINMLFYAIENYPKAKIFIKVHPQTISGRKKGYLYPYVDKNPRLKGKVQLITQNYNPFDLIEGFDVVYTISSQMGFEALLMNKQVVCFGMPFYAGWGLTLDMLKCQRRNIKRSLLEIFTASYIIYTRYLGGIERVISHVKNGVGVRK